MKKEIPTSTCMLFIILLSSCTHYYYMPNVQNVPLFKEKSETRISLNSSSGNDMVIGAIELQAAYAITNHFAVMANYMSANGGKKDSASDWGKGNYYETAIGYYKPLGKKFVFEIYGGGGISNQHHQYSFADFWYGGTFHTGSSDLSFSKLFIQTSIGYTAKAIDIALSARLSNLNFYNIRIATFYNFPELNHIANNENSLLFEPALTIRMGRENVKFQLQAQASNNWSSPNLQFVGYSASIGLWFAFSTKKRSNN